MNDKTRRKNSGECSKKTPKQQQTPENLPQMFQKKAKTTTNAGKSPANVPKKRPKQQHFPEKKLRQMFQITKPTFPLHRCTENNGISPKNDSSYTTM